VCVCDREGERTRGRDEAREREREEGMNRVKRANRRQVKT
jgi:hypothetical protein